MVRSAIGLGLVLVSAVALGVAACGSANGDASTFSGGAGGASGGGGDAGSGGAAAGGGSAGGIGVDATLSDAGSGGGAGDACGSYALNGTTTPGNVIVVFDQSDSMNKAFSDPDAGTNKPKYVAATDSLLAAISPIQAKLNLGAIFFPTIDTASLCSKVDPITNAPPQIGIEPAVNFIADWQNHFSGAFKLILGTPLKDALDNANVAYPDPSPLAGARVVLVITDGAPTCDKVQADILAPVQAMFSRGIKTYVVGLPGSSGAATLLNAIAQAGGTQQYLSPADPQQLENELGQIASSAIDQCTFTFDPPPPDPNQVHLIVSDAGNPSGYEITETDGGDGWTLSPDGKTATLVGSTCDKATNGDFTSLQFVFGCPFGPH
jgi:hypothetical protein